MYTLEDILNFLKNNRDKERSEARDLPHSSLYVPIEKLLIGEGFEYPWIYEIMTSEEGQYAVFNSGSKLYRSNFTVDSSDNVILGEVYKVKIDYPKVEDSEERQKIRVFRNAKTDKLMWAGIASSSVLNRIGEIDSTSLFDDFIKRFNEEDKPYLTLQHLDEKFAFGTVDGILRQDNFLLTYGEVDEGSFLSKHAIERFSEGDYGISIGFKPDGEPSLLKVDNIEIPVYEKGTLVEVSALLETRAASYFTTISNVSSEYKEKRMNRTKEENKKLLLEFTGGENESEIDELLEDVSSRERTIEDEDMISRDVDEDIEFNITDELMKEIVDTATKSVMEIVAPKLEELETMRSSISDLTSSVEKIGRMVDDAVSRIAKTEKSEEDKVNEALEDLPSNTRKRVVVGHRPTKDNDKSESGKEIKGKTNLRKIAEKTLGE